MILLFLILYADKEYNFAGKHGPIYLDAGKYIIHCYGAQGGSGHDEGVVTSSGGKGSYVNGTMTIKGPRKTFYAFVGEHGNSSKSGPNLGGFNGGGSSGEDNLIGWKGNDAGGGGGGATDFRIDTDDFNNRIMVAAGGSGGAGHCNGAPGGKLSGYRTNGRDNEYVESEIVNQIDGNKDGVGGTGKNPPLKMGGSGSGGGGGWRGGVSSGDYFAKKDTGWKGVAHSGSSYISGYRTCNKNDKMAFEDGNMKEGYNEGDGKLIIHIEYICSKNCYECESETKCTKCNDGYILYHGSCYSSCPDGSYSVKDGCEECSTNCKTCSNSKDHCETCKGNDYMLNNVCYSQCPDGYFGEGKSCKECSTNCETCSNSKDRCETCKDGNFLFNNKCSPTCESGYVGINKICQKCDDNCETCSTSTEHCETCKGNDFIYNNKCYEKCPKGTISSGIKCIDCDSSCETCSSSIDHCIKCSEGYFFNNNRCYKDCTIINNQSNREYFGKDEQTKECRKCSDYNCVDCSGDYNTCNQCNNLYVVEKGLCVHPSYVTLVEKNCSNIDRCNYTVHQNRNVLIKVLVTTFSNKKNSASGGAIYLINCALDCNNTNFIRCSSTNGAGGAIYVKNWFEIVNNITLLNLNFTGCESLYGGAVYLYSGYEPSAVDIQNCTFISNKAISNKKDPLFGGSAIYLAAKNVNVFNCLFRENIGEGGAFKIQANLNNDEITESKLLNHINNVNGNNNVITIFDCEFVIDEKTESSISIEGKLRSSIEISECRFKGKLGEGSHHISGTIEEEDMPHLLIQSNCVFENDRNSSIKIEIIKNKPKKEIGKRSRMTVLSYIGLGIIVFAFSIFVAFFILNHANSNKHEDNNQNDELRTIDSTLI